MRRWRLPLVLSALVLLAQLFHQSAIIDVVSGAAPSGVALRWPITHVLLAPLTLTADWLNGGGTGDLVGFAAWTVIVFALWRLFSGSPRTLARAAWLAFLFLAGFGAFIWWGARWSRPIPRLVTTDSSLVIFDTHSHTSASHDGRPGFGMATNAAWHAHAGFDAAFITDHNVFGQVRQWQLDRAGRPPRLLNGEELSLNGLHIVVLGNDSAIPNTPWNASFDSSLALLSLLNAAVPDSARPLLVASLPEYWRHHWGADLGRLTSAGIAAFEIWTTSPKAMDFPPGLRREVIARAASLPIALVGATDMHGLGYAATVWNVAGIPGWRSLDDAVLARRLVAQLRQRPGGVHVIALRRRIAATRGAQIAGTPLSVWQLLRAASRGHALALIGWVWLVAALRRLTKSGDQPGEQGSADSTSSAGS